MCIYWARAGDRLKCLVKEGDAKDTRYLLYIVAATKVGRKALDLENATRRKQARYGF